MSLKTLLLMVGLALGASAAPATAEGRGPEKWGEGGLWNIYVEPVAGNGCYATRVFLSGTVMRIAVRPDGGLHFLMARSSWQFAEVGKTYRMKFVFGNDRTYEEELEAVAVGSVVVLVKPRMSAAFLSDFMEKTSLLVYYRGSLIAPVLLLDTYDAVTQLRTCNASVSGMPDSSDPAFR
jgi:hypothetical protein